MHLYPIRKTDMAVDRLAEYQCPVQPTKHVPRHRNRYQRSGVKSGRSAASRQSDVGVKVRVQSLISTKTHKTTRVAIGSNRENAGFACRGVGHTARGREMPRELHLTGVRLTVPYFPTGLWKGSSAGFPAFWCVAAWCDVRLTHKRSSVRKRIRTSGHDLGGISKRSVLS